MGAFASPAIIAADSAKGGFVELLAEVAVRRGRDAPPAIAQVDVVEVDREDRVLRVLRLEAPREDRLERLAPQRLVGPEELLRDLLRDRRAALRELAGGEPSATRQHALQVDPAVVVEVVILDRGNASTSCFGIVSNGTTSRHWLANSPISVPSAAYMRETPDTTFS